MLKHLIILRLKTILKNSSKVYNFATIDADGEAWLWSHKPTIEKPYKVWEYPTTEDCQAIEIDKSIIDFGYSKDARGLILRRK